MMARIDTSLPVGFKTMDGLQLNTALPNLFYTDDNAMVLHCSPLPVEACLDPGYAWSKNYVPFYYCAAP